LWQYEKLYGSHFPNSEKIRIRNRVKESSFNLRHDKIVTNYDSTYTNDSNRLGVYFSLTESLNNNIIQTFGDTIDIADYVGDPTLLHDLEYTNLKKLKKRFYNVIAKDITIYNVVDIIKYYDLSIFDHIEQLTPARANLIKGVLYDSDILERNKFVLNKGVNGTSTENLGITTRKILTTAENIQYKACMHKINHIISATKLDQNAVIDVENKKLLGSILSQNTKIIVTTGEVKGQNLSFDNAQIMVSTGEIKGKNLGTMKNAGLELLDKFNTYEPEVEPGTHHIRFSYQHVTFVPIYKKQIGFDMNKTKQAYYNNITKLINFEGTKLTKDTTLDGNEPVIIYNGNPFKIKVIANSQDKSSFNSLLDVN